MSSIRPLGNRIVVRRWPEVEQHESGLWLPGSAREKPQMGDVLAVGPGFRVRYKYLKENDWPDMVVAPDINLTDVVVFAKLVSLDYEVTIDNEKLLILPYSSIYCAIQGLSSSI